MEFLTSIFQKRLVGLDIGISGIKAVELSLGKTNSLVAYNRISLPWDSITPEGVIKDDANIVTALQKLFSKKSFSTKNVSVGVFGNSILSKPINIPKMATKDIDEQIYWEAEQYIPFNIEECALDFSVIGNTVQKLDVSAPPQIEVLLVAAKKEYIQSFTGVIERAGLKALVIDYQPFALGNCFEFNYGSEISELVAGEIDLIIDFGAGSTKLSFIEKDNIVYTTKLNQCGSGYTQLISERIGEPFDQAEIAKLNEPDSPLINPIIEDYNAHLTSEIQKSIDVFLGQMGDRSLRRIYYCGGASRTLGLLESIQNKYPSQVEPLNPLKKIISSSSKSGARIINDLICLGSVAVGLAMRKSGDNR